MCFITAGMGGGTGTGAAPIIAQAARELGVLTVGVVTKPFQFEGTKRMRQADEGIEQLQKVVDTLIIIPNQNLFRLANEKTTFTEAFAMADDVLYQGVKGVTDLMVRPGLINLDFADVRAVMNEMGKAMMGTGEAEGDSRALQAAEKAIANPLLDEISLKGARGVLINVTGGYDLTLFELDEAANRIREEVDPDANIIVGSTLDPEMEGKMRVSVVATGIDVGEAQVQMVPARSFAAAAVTPRAAAAAPAPVAATPEPAPTSVAAAPEAAQDYMDADEDMEDAPSLFPGFAAHDYEDDLTDDAVPPPSYRPAMAAPSRQPPRVMATAEPDFIAPRAPAAGRPTPETLQKLRTAIEGNAQSRAASQQPTQAADAPARGRLGLGSLINRMTGHGEEAAAADRRQPPISAVPPQRPAAPAPHRGVDDGMVDPDQERIEIPAFLRRQAN
jgi:cell division protein FtsZ